MTGCLLAAARLSVAAEGAGVVALPRGSLRRPQLHRTDTLVVETAGLATGRGETATLAALHDRVADPINLWIVADPRVERIDENDLVPLVGPVLGNPVGIQDAERRKTTPDLLLGKRA
eukprot:XP_001708726.1 Hypothetical protein GL50803_20056 [Giardia lamblia ATCC 50803]